MAEDRAKVEAAIEAIETVLHLGQSRHGSQCYFSLYRDANTAPLRLSRNTPFHLKLRSFPPPRSVAAIP